MDQAMSDSSPDGRGSVDGKGYSVAGNFNEDSSTGLFIPVFLAAPRHTRSSHDNYRDCYIK